MGTMGRAEMGKGLKGKKRFIAALGASLLASLAWIQAGATPGTDSGGVDGNYIFLDQDNIISVTIQNDIKASPKKFKIDELISMQAVMIRSNPDLTKKGKEILILCNVVKNDAILSGWKMKFFKPEIGKMQLIESGTSVK